MGVVRRIGHTKKEEGNAFLFFAYLGFRASRPATMAG